MHILGILLLQLFSEHSKNCLAESLKWCQAYIILKRSSSFQLCENLTNEDKSPFTNPSMF